MLDRWALGPMNSDKDEADNRRRAGRLQCSMLGSSLGDVLDFSVTGMRCRSSREPKARAGEMVGFMLETLEGAIQMQGRVVWAKKKGWRHFEIGVQFVGVDEAQRGALAAAARVSLDKQHIPRRAAS